MVAALVIVATLLAGVAMADPVGPADPDRCLTCHGMRNLAVRESPEHSLHDFSVSAAFRSSVHGRLTCAQCHGDVGPYPHQRERERAKVTCAQDCHVRDASGRAYSHAGTVADVEASVHQPRARGDRTDRPTCLSCHGSGDPHAIQSSRNLSPRSRMMLCDGCHDDRERMARNEVDPDAVQSYKRSFHYKAVTFGARNTAVCQDCHTTHRIRAHSDSISSVAPAALPATCGQAACHPGAGARFAVSGANHLDLRIKREPILWAEEWLFRLLTVGTMAMLVTGILLDVQKKFGALALIKRFAHHVWRWLMTGATLARQTGRAVRWLVG
jgi:hypothetical protein